MNINGTVTKGRSLEGNIDGVAETVKKQIQENTKARHTHPNKEVLDEITAERVAKWDSNEGGGENNSDLQNNLKYYGRADVEITPAYRDGDDIPSDVKMCLLYTTDEDTHTATITGYISPLYRCWFENDPDTMDEIEFTDQDEEEREYYDIVIPYEVDGYTVTAIGDEAFYYWCADEYVTYEYSEELQCYADFYRRDSIGSITLPTTVTRIGNFGLYGCRDLVGANIQSVSYMGSYVFSGCNSLAIFEFPDSIQYVGENAFCDTRITKLRIPSSLKKCEANVYTDMHELKTVYIEYGITAIDDSAFWGSGVVNVNIPESVAHIGESAFHYCNLEKVVIPSSVKTIESNAFSGCKLKAVEFLHTARLKDELGDYIDNGEELVIGDGAFVTYREEEPIFYVVQDSVAEEWCIRNNKTYTYTSLHEVPYSSNNTMQSFVNVLGGIENWEAEDIVDANNNVIGSRYGQIVNVNNAVITPNSKVDLQISSEQMVVFYEKSLAFVAENDDGVITIYCVGDVPKNNYTMQVTVTEVVSNG